MYSSFVQYFYNKLLKFNAFQTFIAFSFVKIQQTFFFKISEKKKKKRFSSFWDTWYITSFSRILKAYFLKVILNKPCVTQNLQLARNTKWKKKEQREYGE